MRCFKCSTENSEGRKFCGECGSHIAHVCSRCGFGNALADKYCGGCGARKKDVKISKGEEGALPQITDVATGKYSADDICELTDKSCQEKKKKGMKDTDELSQDTIDNIFGSDNSDTNKKEK